MVQTRFDFQYGSGGTQLWVSESYGAVFIVVCLTLDLNVAVMEGMDSRLLGHLLRRYLNYWIGRSRIQRHFNHPLHVFFAEYIRLEILNRLGDFCHYRKCSLQ